MKKFSSVLVAIFLIFSVSFSFAADAKKLTAKQEKKLEQKAKKICDGMMPLYGLALDSYYKKKDDNAVRIRLSNKIDLDKKIKVYYTDYLEKDPLINAVMSVSAPHAKKIMAQYPDDQGVYKQSIEVTKTMTLPPVCQRDMKEAFRG